MKYLLISLLMLNLSDKLAANTASHQFQPQIAQQSSPVQPQGVLFATVGTTPDCDFNVTSGDLIQDAIDDLSFGEIRIQTGTYNENLNLTNRDVTIKGGYVSCAAAEVDNMTLNQFSVDTLITPIQPTSNPVITIIGNDETRNFVTLENLRLSNGVDNFLLTSGGISTFTDELQLTLNHVWIENNEGSFGGGLSILGGNTDVEANNVMFLNNTADQGGGVYCSGENASILIDYHNTQDDRFGFFGNSATDPTEGDGGAALVENGCNLLMYTGTDTPSLAATFDVRGMFNNAAVNNGGGLAVRDGGRAGLYGYQFCFIGCNGNQEDPVLLLTNTADSDGDNTGRGGGLSVTGAGSEVFIANALIWANSAGNGAGIWVNDNAVLEANSTYDILFQGFVDCWSPGSCNQITQNEAVNTGGGVLIENGASAEINRTVFTENRANFGTAAYVIDANSVLDSEGVLFAGNGDNANDGFGDNNVIRINTGGTAIMDFTTVADNNIPDANEVIDNSNGTVRLRSSIVHEPNPVVVYRAATAVLEEFDCLVVHNNTNLPFSPGIVVDDPEFVDRLNGDYHLDEATSPAIDFCDDLLITPDYRDIDNDERPWDWSNQPNFAGPFDLGFDETTDLIFADDFELDSIPL